MMGSCRKAWSRDATTADLLTGNISPVQDWTWWAGRQEEGAATCQAQLTRARLAPWLQGPFPGPGACFGPEVTRALGCGQLGHIHSICSWIPGFSTKYGTACAWHPRCEGLRWHVLPPQWAQPPPHPTAGPDHPSASGPAFRALHGPTIRLLLSVHIGLKILRTKIASPCRGNQGWGNKLLGLHHSSAAHPPRQLMQLLTPVSSLTFSPTH